MVADDRGYVLKVIRAVDHLKLIAAAIEHYVEYETAVVQRKTDPPDGWVFCEWGDFEPPSALISTYLGDAVHNMRSALDCLMHDTVSRFGNELPDVNTTFPICDSPSEWARQIVHRNPSRPPAPTHGCPPEVVKAIEQVQPFQPDKASFNRSLATLRMLSNTDKHRRLHVVACLATKPITSIHLEPLGHYSIEKLESQAPGTSVEPHAEIFRFKLVPMRPKPLDVGVRFKQTAQIHFRDSESSLDIAADELDDIALAVCDAIDVVEAACGLPIRTGIHDRLDELARYYERPLARRQRVSDNS